MTNPNILITGAGPAGLTAAIQLKRYGLTPILLERERVGGLLRNANLVENYPGFPNGISGPKLVALFERQMWRVEVEVTFGEVTRLDFENDEFTITVGRDSNPAVVGDLFQRLGNPRYNLADSVYHAQVVVIATGTKARPIPVVIPQQAQGRVFSEVWPLLKEKNKHIAIVGAGDAAFDYALNLAGRENTVTILDRGHEPTCLPLLRERASANSAITYHEQTTIQRVEIDAPTARLSLITDHCSLTTDYLLFAIGREPAMDFLTERVKLQASALIESGKLYFVGDVHNGLFRQTAIAVGEGLRAAMQIYEKVRGTGS